MAAAIPPPVFAIAVTSESPPPARTNRSSPRTTACGDSGVAALDSPGRRRNRLGGMRAHVVGRADAMRIIAACSLSESNVLEASTTA